MGRGLSDLQKQILVLANECRKPESVTVFCTTIHTTPTAEPAILEQIKQLGFEPEQTFIGYGFVVVQVGKFTTYMEAENITRVLQNASIPHVFTDAETANKPDLTIRHILSSVYGFMEIRPTYTDKYGRDRTKWLYQFMPEHIGKKHYQTAYAAVSRAMKRLEMRGFIIRKHNQRGALWITPEGISYAEALLVKTEASVEILTDKACDLT